MARNAMSRPRRQSQRGTSLLVGMIMLVLLTLLALSAWQSSNGNLRVVGNMQVREETLAAAQTATEQAVSSPTFIKTPPADVVVNLNGADYTVKFDPPPACVSVVDIPSEDLDPKNADDLKCIPSGVVTESGVFVSGIPLPPSYCSNTRWAVTAAVKDPSLSAPAPAVTTLEQGVAVRVSKAKVLTYCP